DLEDGVQDPLDPSRTPQLKASARESIQQFFAHARDIPPSLSLRINVVGSGELERDLDMLRHLADRVGWNEIYLPKIERYSTVAEIRSMLRARGITWRSLVPTIETVAGVEQLGELLQEDVIASAGKVQFGHYDYNLDAGNWPFVDQ